MTAQRRPDGTRLGRSAREGLYLLRAGLVDPRRLRELVPERSELAHPIRFLRALRLAHRLRREGFTMLTRRRGRALYRLAAEVVERGVPGALVDCGVWNGGSTALLSAGAPGRQVWAFDSFAGLPQPGPKDEESETAGRAGDLSTSEQRLREAFARFGHPERLRVRKGWFEETFPRAREEVGPVALVHCDGDWYDSIRLTLETFYPKLSPGGFVVVDDYGHFAGARRATDDFRSERRISAPLVAVDGPAVYWRK